MEDSNGGEEPEWITRLRGGGSVPLLHPDKCSNGWSSPPGNIFTVRGPNYFTDKTKVPGGDYLLKPLGFDWIKGPTKISDLLMNPEHRVMKAINAEFPNGNKPFVWAFNIQLPSKDHHSIVSYFASMEPIQECSMLDKFLKGDDGYRNSRLKLSANLPKAPRIVKKAVGDNAVCMVGKAMTCRYRVTENFIEVDIDVWSSIVWRAVVEMTFGYLATVTVDILFIIEGVTEKELPERILGAIRFGDLQPSSASTWPADLSCDEGVTGDSQSSLSTRLWKSLGRGLSKVVRPGAQQGGQVEKTAN